MLPKPPLCLEECELYSHQVEIEILKFMKCRTRDIGVVLSDFAMADASAVNEMAPHHWMPWR